jgi:hypothetical protein
MDPRKVRTTIFLSTGIAVDIVGFALWLRRSPRVHSGWPGLPHYFRSSHSKDVLTWLAGDSGPWTPTGFLSVFTPEDLLEAAAMLTALVVFIVFIVATWSEPWRRRLESARLRWSRLSRFRVRTALVLTALVAIYLGWELDAWRSWRVRRVRVRRARTFASVEASNKAYTGRLRQELKANEADFGGGPFDWETPEALAARKALRRERLQRDLMYAEAVAAAAATLEQKYRIAAARPYQAIAPDPPLPERPRDPFDPALFGGGCAGALAANDEQLRRYPDLIHAHASRAWILATCPDAGLRDGEGAVASATRACELSHWKNTEMLQTLAAAYAEAGDFDSAARWYETALALLAIRLPRTEMEQILAKDTALALYRNGQPFRHDHHVPRGTMGAALAHP